MLALRLMVLYLVASVGTGFALRPMPAASRQRRRGGVGGAGVRMMGGAGDGAVVGEYMTTPCISVTPNMSLKDAAKILVDRKIAGAPVTSRDNKVIGVISQFDFLFKEAGPGAVKPLNLNSPTYRTDAQKMMSNKVRRAHRRAHRWATLAPQSTPSPAS